MQAGLQDRAPTEEKATENREGKQNRNVFLLQTLRAIKNKMKERMNENRKL